MLTAAPFDGDTILPLALLKARVRVLNTDEDADITRIRDQMIRKIERYSGYSLQLREFVWSESGFCSRMTLPVAPVATVEGISYFATDGTDTALDEADWLYSGGAVQPAIGTSWPHASVLPGSVRVTFTAGFTDAEAEAPDLIAAVELAVAAYFADRENPNFTAAESMADGYRGPGL